jgi:hypothetical protein
MSRLGWQKDAGREEGCLRLKLALLSVLLACNSCAYFRPRPSNVDELRWTWLGNWERIRDHGAPGCDELD